MQNKKINNLKNENNSAFCNMHSALIKLQRINSDILRILSIAINQKLSDPMVHDIDVIRVETGVDLSESKVYVSIAVDDAIEQQRILAALQAASGFLRTEVAESLKGMKKTPKLRFIIDKGRENAIRVDELLDIINATKGEE